MARLKRKGRAGGGHVHRAHHARGACGHQQRPALHADLHRQAHVKYKMRIYCFACLSQRIELEYCMCMQEDTTCGGRNLAIVPLQTPAVDMLPKTQVPRLCNGKDPHSEPCDAAVIDTQAGYQQARGARARPFETL